MTRDDAPDSDLIEQTRSGNNDAFRVLVRRYEAAVAATVIGMLGRCPEAQDVGQQVFIRFFRSINDFRGDASLKTYLTRIAINLSLNELKRRRRSVERFSALDEQTDEPTTTDWNDDAEIEKSEKVRLVTAAIDRLDDPFKSVVVLRMIHGYSVKETAEMLDVPSGTVLSRLARAQKKLAAILAPYVTS